jgi:hypothetical protein
MAKWLAALLTLAASAWAQAAPSFAVAVCNCCVTAQSIPTCGATCAAMTVAAGHQCPVFVDYTAPAVPGALNGASYMGIALGDPSEAQLESFRRFLERQRRRAWRLYRQSLADFEAGRITADGLTEAKAVFREAMVNYNHGIHAYLVKLGRKSD